jgi:hypothetical protein
MAEFVESETTGIPAILLLVATTNKSANPNLFFQNHL